VSANAGHYLIASHAEFDNQKIFKIGFPPEYWEGDF
jgi:hypothetical protein